MRRDVPTDEKALSAVFLEAAGDDVQDEADANMANVSEEDGSDTSDESCGSTPMDLSLAVPALCFLHVEGPVLVLDVSRDSRHVVTLDHCGVAFVWRLDAGVLAFVCRRSVAIAEERVWCAAFSPDSTLLCTGDTSGCVRVWRIDVPRVVCEFVTFGFIKWVRWNHEDNALLAGTVDGIVCMWKVPGGECNIMQGSFTTCGDGRVLADGRRAAAVYDDGSVCIWDLKRARLLHDLSGPNRIHDSRVTSLDVGGELVATGAYTVHVLHSGTGHVVATFPRILLDLPPGDDDNKVCTLSFQSQQETLAAGTHSGVLALLDLSSCAERRRYVHPYAISRVVWRGPHTVLTSCGDGIVRAFDVRTDGSEPVARWKCASRGLMSLAMCRDGLCFVTSCCLGMCGVYRFQTPL
ncbi:angio-associated migratory cell protein-like [Haemaphysalis longicornis]